MGTQAQTSAKPTNRQLAYIRDLNSKTGTDFVYPGSAGRARREIERLMALSRQQDDAIARFIALTDDSGLPGFDEVRREGTGVRFLWNDRKVMVVVDLIGLDDPAGGDTTDGAAIAA